MRVNNDKSTQGIFIDWINSAFLGFPVTVVGVGIEEVTQERGKNIFNHSFWNSSLSYKAFTCDIWEFSEALHLLAALF